MSGGTACKCRPKQRAVVQRNYNRSAFNGGKVTHSDYSLARCVICGTTWRTRAKYVARLPDVLR